MYPNPKILVYSQFNKLFFVKNYRNNDEEYLEKVIIYIFDSVLFCIPEIFNTNV